MPPSSPMPRVDSRWTSLSGAGPVGRGRTHPRRPSSVSTSPIHHPRVGSLGEGEKTEPPPTLWQGVGQGRAVRTGLPGVAARPPPAGTGSVYPKGRRATRPAWGLGEEGPNHRRVHGRGGRVGASGNWWGRREHLPDLPARLDSFGAADPGGGRLSRARRRREPGRWPASGPRPARVRRSSRHRPIPLSA